jgi:tRNA1(Val) A37 N6-methylase TrmN6
MSLNKLILKSDLNNYGIVYTPENLVNSMLDLIPIKFFKNKNLKWLDVGAGKGAFSLNLLNRLIKNLRDEFETDEACKSHILKNMLYMVEIFEPHIDSLISLFGKEANIITMSFLSMDECCLGKFDFIIGNPPYNINGSIKTPTNSKMKKTDDGKAIYVEFIIKSIELLNDGGFINFVVPSLWLKPDKSGLYNILTELKIQNLACLSTSDSSKAFEYKAQTPVTYFLIENSYEPKKNNMSSFKIYDKIENEYINYSLKKNEPIPINGVKIINRMKKYLDKYGSLQFYKTNTPSLKMKISDISGENLINPNIKTCLLDGLKPKIILNYSNIKCKYSDDKPKLVLAHKMFGVPYLDFDGKLGISSRDNYVINDYSLADLGEIQLFLSSKFALFIFSVCNYRMRYLERYAFSFIPDITKIPNFPKLKDTTRTERDIKIYEYFSLTKKEIEYIEKSFKNYDFFI